MTSTKALLKKWRDQAATIADMSGDMSRALLMAADQLEKAVEQDETRAEQASTKTPSTLANWSSWRERLWTAPPQTRLSREEALEALGKSRSWLYRSAAADSLPRAKDASGDLVFVVGHLRQWLNETDKIIVANGPYQGYSE